jgi:hypothetical protein
VIKRKRLAEPADKSFKTIAFAVGDMLAQKQRAYRENIISCTIEESILYG